MTSMEDASYKDTDNEQQLEGLIDFSYNPYPSWLLLDDELPTQS